MSDGHQQCMHGMYTGTCLKCMSGEILAGVYTQTPAPVELPLPEILKVLRAHDVLTFKGYGLEVNFQYRELPVKRQDDEPLAPKTEAIGEAAGKPTDDEMLFWSAGGIDIKSDKPEE